MRTLALNGCMWYIVSLTGFRVGRPPPPPPPPSATIVVISSLRVNTPIHYCFQKFHLFRKVPIMNENQGNSAFKNVQFLFII